MEVIIYEHGIKRGISHIPYIIINDCPVKSIFLTFLRYPCFLFSSLTIESHIAQEKQYKHDVNMQVHQYALPCIRIYPTNNSCKASNVVKLGAE